MSSHPRSARSALLAQRAAAMRKQPTLTEAKLWNALRGGRLGVAFRRQVVIADFIVDFAAFAARLIVEVDGAYHALRGRADARRDATLARLGFRVVRLDAELVLRDLPRALRTIRAVV